MDLCLHAYIKGSHLIKGSGCREEEVMNQERLMRIETSSDWPASIQPNTLLALLSQKMNESSLTLDNLGGLISLNCSNLPWLLKLSTLTSLGQSMPGKTTAFISFLFIFVIHVTQCIICWTHPYHSNEQHFRLANLCIFGVSQIIKRVLSRSTSHFLSIHNP